MVKRETDDVESFVRALRFVCSDTGVCNGKIGLVGGSSGATHAAWVILNTNPTPNDDWPHWFENGHDDRPDCAALLSGTYDFSDRTPASYPPGHDPLPEFIQAVENYTRTGDLTAQKQFSPVYLVAAPNEDLPFKPLLMINSQYDHPVPSYQIQDMVCALESVGISQTLYQTMTISDSSEHSSSYWSSYDGQRCLGPCKDVAADVIAFLDAHLK